jgi:putative phosphoesterase
MRLGIVTDIHGDAAALDAALAHLRRLNADALWCMGDVIGDGSGSEAVVARLNEAGASCIAGNHERWKLDDFSDEGADLSRDSLKWLRALPSSRREVIAGVRVAMIHGDARSVAGVAGVRMAEAEADPVDVSVNWPLPSLRALLDDADADVLLVGHTHDAYCLAVDGGLRLVANPGACCRLGQTFARKPLPRRKLCAEGPGCALEPGRLWVPTGQPRKPMFATLWLPARELTAYRIEDDGSATKAEIHRFAESEPPPK